MQDATYKKLSIKRFAPRALRETAEGRYWRAFDSPTVIEQVGGVTNIDFVQTAPHHFACTSSTRVLLYDANTLKRKKQFTRFKDIAYSGSLREDGKVLAAGGENGLVQLFDTSSRSLLRHFEGHKAAVRKVKFASDKVHVCSGSDDATVRWWDIAQGVQVHRLDGHTDYVRGIAPSPSGPEVWASGAYDHTWRVWDMRSGASVMQMDHGAPIEDLCFFPSSSLLATCGSNSVCIWDMLAGGRLLRRLTNHQKTITCLRIIEDIGPPSQMDLESSTGATRMFTGSLDGHVKVYDVDTFKVTHVAKYPGPVLSMGVAPDCSVLAVGTGNRMLCIRKRKKPRETLLLAAAGKGARAQPKSKAKPRTGTYRYYIRGKGQKAVEGDMQVAKRRRANLAPFDRKLKAFRLGEALDAALLTRQGEVIVSVIEELSQRGGLLTALAGRTAETLYPVLSFLCRHIIDPRFSRLLISVATAVLDVYGSVIGQSAAVDQKLALLRERIVVEVQTQEELLKLQGCLEPVLAAALQ